MAGGMVWVVTLPYWVIAEPKQVEIEGEELLSEAKVRELLSFPYPQSIWQLPTHKLNQRLLAAPPLLEATLTRQLSPPRLSVKIEERQPVALAWNDKAPGYLDGEGVFIPKSFYEKRPRQLLALSLKVLGMQPKYRENWQEVYHLINNFPIKVSEVHWQDPSNFVLKTELGKVHFGPYSSQFPQQIKQLAQLRSLSAYIPLAEIVYIDLANPEVPKVQLKQKPQKQPLNSLVNKQ
jgi:cell division protein FtsQ